MMSNMTEATVIITDNKTVWEGSNNRNGIKYDEVVDCESFSLSEKRCYYILDLNEENERKIIDLLIESGLSFDDDFITIWANKSKLSRNNFSYILLKNNKPSSMSVLEAIKVVKGKKKLCFVYGNCQITVITRMLSSSDNFVKDYNIVQLPEVFKPDDILNDYEEFTKSLALPDLYVHQYVNVDNKFSKQLSTKVLFNYLNKNSKKICFPNSYVGFYYPQFCSPCLDVRPPSEILPYGDSNIHEIVKKDQFDDIKKILYSEDLYSEKFIKNFFEKSIDELKSREKRCDIIISDYIIDNYQKKCLGYSPNHPINDVLEEVTKRILKMMGIEEDHLNSSLALDQYEMIIYPSVLKHLNVSFVKDRFNINNKITPKPLDIVDYCKYHIYYTSPLFFYNQTQNHDLSPGFSVSRNADLLENKSLYFDGTTVCINLSFRTHSATKIRMHLPRKCTPGRVIPITCVASSKNYYVKIMPDGFFEFEIGKENWAVINASFMP